MTLTDLIAKNRTLLIDFDGPICSVFAGHPAAAVADELRAVIRHRLGGELPPAIAELKADPLQILTAVASLDDEQLTHEVADACRDAETAAVATAAPTPGAEGVFRVARGTGRRTVIVSNNATDAIAAYLRKHGLLDLVDGIAARYDGMDPRLLKPNPFLLKRGLATADTTPGTTAFIGDSVTDIEAGQAAGTPTIGYANKPGKHQRLTDVGADLVIDSMHTLTEVLRSATARRER